MVDLVLRVLGCGFVRGLVVVGCVVGAWFVGFLVDWRVLFRLVFLFLLRAWRGFAQARYHSTSSAATQVLGFSVSASRSFFSIPGIDVKYSVSFIEL